MKASETAQEIRAAWRRWLECHQATPSSVWLVLAEKNKRRIEGLLAEGRVAPAGLAAIEAAKGPDHGVGSTRATR